MPTAPTTTKQENVHLRATSEEKALLAAAAEYTHQNLTQFVLTTALKAAETILTSDNNIRLTPDAYDAFVARLDEPARDIPALREMLSRPSVFGAADRGILTTATTTTTSGRDN